jgi:hypothetical protein
MKTDSPIVQELKSIREKYGYSQFDFAIKSINRERLQNDGREKRKHFSWAKYGSLYKNVVVNVGGAVTLCH